MIQKFMTRLLVPVLLLTLTACEVTTSTDSTKPGSSPTNPNNNLQTEEGGISGGGGGTLPADPLYVFQVVRILEDAKPKLRMIIRYHQQFNTGIGLEDKFYFEKENLATQLEKTDLEILQDAACKDKFGNDVDASIHASRPNTICISAFRIAPKVIKENANKEIMALLVHELGHFLGATEAEARELQRRTALFMRGVTDEFAEKFFMEIWGISESFGSTYSAKERISEAIKKQDLAAIQTELGSLKKKLEDYAKPLQNIDLALIDSTIMDYERIIRTKIFLAQLFMDTLTESGSQQEMSKNFYDECFANQSQQKAKDLVGNCRHSVFDDNIYGDFMVPKINNLSELDAYLDDVVVYFYDLSNHVRSIAFDQVLPKFNLPTTPKEVNPWLKFAGKYKASLLDCARSANVKDNPHDGLTELEIKPGVVNYPIANIPVAYVTKVFGSMWMTDAYYNHHDSANLSQVFGSPTKAELTEEQGTRWYDRQGHGYNKGIKSLELVNGQYIFTIGSENFTYDYKGLYQAEASCRYQLTPQ